ncbi:hypothetical protein B7486_07095 [cyanobacterium TDX16]|nr:hypothetical protein B7486_07095 [cyanobacterium TDX16]
MTHGGEVACWWSVAKRQAASLLARKSCTIEGDNRRKKFGRSLVTRAAGMCWGGLQTGWFLLIRL